MLYIKKHWTKKVNGIVRISIRVTTLTFNQVGNTSCYTTQESLDFRL